MNAFSHKFHYFYKITHVPSGCYYFGIHSTDNLDDGYMGSGTRISQLISKYGKKHFKKEIIKFFENRQKLSLYEKEIVNEDTIKDPLCLNLIEGGDWGERKITTKGLVTVRDKNGDCFDVRIDDPRYLSGEYKSVNHGSTTVRDKDGNTFRVNIDDELYKSGQYTSVLKGNTGFLGRTTIYKDGKYQVINKCDLEEYINNGWEKRSKCRGRISPTKGMIYISKESESKMIHREDVSIYILDGWHLGRVTKPNSGKICVKKGDENKYIDKCDLEEYINIGWVRGGTSRNTGKVTCTLDNGLTFIQLGKNDPRLISGEAKTIVQLKSICKGTKYIHKGEEIKRVPENELDLYLKKGYSLGRKI